MGAYQGVTFLGLLRTDSSSAKRHPDDEPICLSRQTWIAYDEPTGRTLH